MTLTLSASDVARLQTAFATLVAPLDHASVAAWRFAAFESVRALLGADKGFHMLPVSGEELVVGPETDSEGYVAWQSYYHTLDTGFVQRRRELGLEVAHMLMVYDPRDLKKTEIYNDFSAHYGFLDGMSMTLDLDPTGPPAALTFYHEREDGPEFGERGLDLLRLLLPAFKAGVRTCQRLASHRSELSRLFDRSAQSLLLCSLSGGVLHETPALRALLAAEPEADRLRRAMTPVAHRLGALVRTRKSVGTIADVAARAAEVAEGELRTASARYRIWGAVLGEGLITADPVVLVQLERQASRPLTADELTRRFRFTPRELAVARLLAEGRSNAEIAGTLGIRPRTAEQHTARVLSKLGLRSRGAVGAALRGERELLHDRPVSGSAVASARAS